MAMFSARVREKRNGDWDTMPMFCEERGGLDVADVRAIDEYGAPGRLQQARQYVHEGGLSAPDRPGDADELSRRNRHAHVSEAGFFMSRVCEGEVLHLEGHGRAAQLLPVRAPLHRPLEDGVDPAHGADALLDQRHDPAEGQHGEGERGDHDVELEELPQAHGAGDHLPSRRQR